MSDPVKITRQSLASEAVAGWSEQFEREILGGGRATTIHAALVALGPAPDPDAVDAAIGNGAWTRVPSCDGCGRKGLPVVVQVGEEPEYESSTVDLCGDCLRAALALLDADGSLRLPPVTP